MSGFRENDVVLWHWKNGQAPIIGRYAHLAVYFKGSLRDTYWHDWQYALAVDLDRVECEVLGNINDCTVIQSYDLAYYNPADVINMNHSNNSRAPIYLKSGATKNQEWMLARAQEKFEDAVRAKDRADRDIVEWGEKVKKIIAGDLEVYL